MCRNIIRAPNHLGDCIMALAALQSIPDNFNYYLLAPNWSQQLFINLSGAKILPVPSEYMHGVSSIMYQKKIIKDRNIEKGLLLTPSFSSALIFLLGRVNNRFGYPTDYRRALLNNPVSTIEETIHRSDSYLNLLETFTGLELKKVSPQINVGGKMSVTTRKLLQKGRLDNNEKYIATIKPEKANPR